MSNIFCLQTNSCNPECIKIIGETNCIIELLLCITGLIIVSWESVWFWVAPGFISTSVPSLKLKWLVMTFTMPKKMINIDVRLKILTYYYMANPVLGKSLRSDWFFLGQDFAVKTVSMETVQPVYFALERSRQIQN